jgi:alanyl-tRNA synthetase
MSVCGCQVTTADGFTLSDEKQVVRGWGVLDNNPFYPESGGQLGDRECFYLRRNDGTKNAIEVEVVNRCQANR